jgi:uncharacterized oligopeptide transporter (OPT) family protein
VLRVVAMLLFGLMFLAEAGDLYGLVLALADPVPAADRFGITASAEVLRSTLLLILALVVCIGALLAQEAGALSHERPSVRDRIPRVRSLSGG